MTNISKGTLEWETEHIVENCDLINETSNSTDTTINNEENMYCFQKKFCTKTAGRGVTMQSQTSTRDRNEIVSILTVNEFVLFDASDDDVEPIWLERIMSNPEWQNQGVYHNLDRQNVSFDGVRANQ